VSVAADAREVLDDIADRDRLRTHADPPRTDHRRQTVDERDDRLETGASASDDDRGAKGRQRDRSGGELPLRLQSAPQMRGQIGRVVAEAAEIDELAQPRSFRLVCDGSRRCAIPLLEVLSAQRVHEVVRDLDAVQRPADRGSVVRVGLQPGHIVTVSLVPRDRHDIVRTRQRRQQSAPDGSRRAEDGDPHRASRTSRAK
jgi:hypothetical protein